MRIGIDLGGTKIEIIVLDVCGKVIFRHRVATPQGQYQQTLTAIVDLVKQAREQAEVETASIGMGIPGAISIQSGLVKNANSVCLIGQPLQQDLQHLLAQPIRISNDANCLTVSEATDGAAAGSPVVFGVILGTGTGGGLAVEQRVLNGANAISGEWGHNAMPWCTDETEIKCYCGLSNCIETFLSGPGMLQRFHLQGGRAKSVEAIISQAHSGDTQAEMFMQKYEHWLAKGLASVINVLDPDAIVLGGGLSNIDRLYQNVPRIWSEYIFSDQLNTRLLKAKYGDSSGVRGAAWLWPA